MMGATSESRREDIQDWLAIPQHMLQINESAFVPAYGVDE
jgi:hypothetical protein